MSNKISIFQNSYAVATLSAGEATLTLTPGFWFRSDVLPALDACRDALVPVDANGLVTKAVYVNVIDEDGIQWAQCLGDDGTFEGNQRYARREACSRAVRSAQDALDLAIDMGTAQLRVAVAALSALDD